MPQHSTLIAEAKPVARILRAAGIVVHPGVINPHPHRAPHSVMIIEVNTRIRIKVVGSGVQELFIYGKAENLEAILAKFKPSRKIMKTG